MNILYLSIREMFVAEDVRERNCVYMASFPRIYNKEYQTKPFDLQHGR